MSRFIKTDVSVPAVTRYLERDYALRRGYSKGLLDLSNPYCRPSNYVIGAAIPDETALSALQFNAATGLKVNGSADGSITADGAFTVGAGASGIVLPNSTDWQLPSDGSVSRALMIVWAKLKTSYPSNTVGANLIFGDNGNTVSAANTFVNHLVPTGGGAPNTARVRILSVQVACDEINDGNLHQNAFYYDKLTSPGNVILSYYKDKVFVRSVTVPTPTIVAPSGSYSIFPNADASAYARNAGFNQGNKVYRAHLLNLTGSTEDVAAVILDDYNSTIPYVS